MWGFESRVASAHWNEQDRLWVLTLTDGTEFTCRFLVTAIGPLSAPVVPKIEGLSSFKGEAYYTALWPKDPVSFEGKRVAVIGTGGAVIGTVIVVNGPIMVVVGTIACLCSYLCS